MPVMTYSLTVPKMTLESAPVELVDVIGCRYIKNVTISFPDGCLNTVGIQILDDGRLFIPQNTGWLFGNDRQIVLAENHRMVGPPYRLSIRGYSFAKDWPHTVSVTVEISNKGVE